MKFKSWVTAGILLSIGGLQWFFCIIIAEGMHLGFNITPGGWIPYSSKTNYISDLGVGSTALLYNASLFILGLTVIGAALLHLRDYKSRLFSTLLVITGVGAAGVALFPADVQPLHGIFQAVAMLFGSIAAMATLSLERTPLSSISLVLGAFSIIATVVFFPYLGLNVEDPVTFLGLGKGAMERLAIYPILMWIIGYGFYLMGVKKVR
jgi:hypothetical membrane protein